MGLGGVFAHGPSEYIYTLKHVELLAGLYTFNGVERGLEEGGPRPVWRVQSCSFVHHALSENLS